MSKTTPLSTAFLYELYATALRQDQLCAIVSQHMRSDYLPNSSFQRIQKVIQNHYHTKNISFLMDKTGTWKLSPAYDVSWAYNPKGEWTSHHQMSINNKWDNITRADLMAVAEAMHIKRVSDIINEICHAVSMWPTIAKEYDIPSSMVTDIDETLLYRSY